MLAVHILHNRIRFAQLVNFKGTPFIETLGEVEMKSSLKISDLNNGEMIRLLSDHLVSIRNSAEFPDNSVHLVLDSDWFPSMVHTVDDVLEGRDLHKYLEWRTREMLESNTDQYKIVHQSLGHTKSGEQSRYYTVCVPHSLDEWVEKVFHTSELEVKDVILDIQAAGDMLTAAELLLSDGGIQVVLENRENGVKCFVYKDQEFYGLIHASLNWDYKLTPDYVRGDVEVMSDIASAIEKALKGKGNPDNALTHLFYLTTTGDPELLSNLSQYDDSCRELKLVKHFNFRDPEFDNIDTYALVLGALHREIRERFNED